MILCTVTNLNSAFAAKIKARRGRGKEKTKTSRNGFFRISIPFGLLGFDFIPIFRSIKWKEKGKSVAHTNISHVV